MGGYKLKTKAFCIQILMLKKIVLIIEANQASLC